MEKYALTHSDLVEHLREQLGFLKASASAYDGGFEGEAKRMATVLRVVLHDRPRSKSLLGQLAVKDDLAYLNTAEPIDPRNLMPTVPGLVMMRLESGVGGTYVPRFEGRPEQPASHTAFAPWWTSTVARDSQGERFTREDYVLALANKDGGAHVDPRLDARYRALSRDNSFGWESIIHDEDGREAHAPFSNNPVLPSVRQITYEFLSTAESQLGYLLDPPADPRDADLPTGLLRRISRNDPCPCGSGVKAKRCHLG